MKRIILNCLVVFFLMSGVNSRVFAEEWKGEPNESQIGLGALMGSGLIDSTAGFAVVGTASKKLIQHGFLSDINNAVSIEGQFGPIFISGTTAWFYSAHLRWDFEKNSTWGVYALGGFGGNAVAVNSSTRFEFFPRFGVGGFWKLSPVIQLRGELSHELIGVGVIFPI